MKIGGYQILDLYNFDFTVGTGQTVPGVYALIKSLRGKPINTSNIIIGGVVYPASYVSFIPDGTSFKGTFGDKTITVANNDTVTITNGIIGGGGGGGTQVQANWTEEDTSDPSYIQNKPTLAEVATSGDYDDLENKPTIPAPQVQSDWNETDIDDPSYIKNKPTISIMDDIRFDEVRLNMLCQPRKTVNDWIVKNWTPALGNLLGNQIWTDSSNIYYSNNTTQYVLDRATSTWSSKLWNGLTEFEGRHVWTDGTNIYYSNSTNHYVLDVATSTWSLKEWFGLTTFSGASIWSDGANIYYSTTTAQYVLDVATSTWSAKEWSGVTNFQANDVWTDGTNIYHSTGTAQHILDVATSTWSTKEWTGLSSFSGQSIWTDGTNIYSSSNLNQYVLDVANSTWSAKEWNGLSSFTASNLWTDGAEIYYSYLDLTYKLNRR